MKKFSIFALLSLAAAAAGIAVVMSLDLPHDVRSDALLGVALSAASGGLALVRKRRALMKTGLKAVMTAMVSMFFLRVLLLAIGLWAVVHAGGAELAFVIGFFAIYFVQQTLELSWVVHASKDFNGAPAT